MLCQYPNALSDARSAVDLDPEFVKGYLRAAKASVAMGDTVTARQALEKAKELEPNNAVVQTELANVASLEKFIHDAREALSSKDYRKVNKGRALNWPLLLID